MTQSATATQQRHGAPATQRELLDAIGRDVEHRLRALPYVVGAFFAGSAANEELLFSDAPDRRLLSDVEIGIVTTRPWKKRDVRAIAASVGAAHRAEIDAFLVTRARLRHGLHKNIGLTTQNASVFAYEISQAARWIYCRSTLPHREWQPADIHPWEGVRLILNRIGEGAPWLAAAQKDGAPDASRARWSVKTLLASGDALLLSLGQFAPSYAGRALLWETHGCSLLSDEAARAAVARAYRTRSGGIDAGFHVKSESTIAAAREGVRAGLAASGFPAGSPTAAKDPAVLRRYLTSVRLPTLHTLAGGRIDAVFDSALRLPRLRDRRVRTGAVLANWRGRGCLQHWAYAPLLIGLDETTPDGLYARAREEIEPFFEPSGRTDSTLVREWWQVMCR